MLFETFAQEEVLGAVVKKEISLTELKEEAGKHRDQLQIRKAFCRSTNSTWEEALQRFPHHTRADRLYQFLRLNFRNNIPEAFRSYCQAALQSEEQSVNSADNYTHDGSTAYCVCHSSLTISHTDIRNSKVPFSGCHLFVVDVKVA